MERGEDKSAFAVIAIIGIIGVLASVALFLKQPIGFVAQGQTMYTTEDGMKFGIYCQNEMQQVVYMGSNMNYHTFCCLEDMNGQNDCRIPRRIQIT